MIIDNTQMMIAAVVVAAIVLLIKLLSRQRINHDLHRDLAENNALLSQLERQFEKLREQQSEHADAQSTRFNQFEVKGITSLNQQIESGLTKVRQQLSERLTEQNTTMHDQYQRLTANTERHLTGISQRVNEQLNEGFSKTGELFNRVLNRLSIIDKAQERISELTHHVVDLQSVLSDKKSRGAFGEVQLIQLIKNVIPSQHFQAQYTLKNGNRVDCMLFLPEPTGHVAIDAKFPMETFRTMQEQPTQSGVAQKTTSQQFKRDIKKHIDDIADKYIVPHETADGAVMFIPAEAVFAEIHANHPDLVEYAQRRCVWLTSPTTMMAVLTTASAVIKDIETRKQVGLIQKHLRLLGTDFGRFHKRLDNLSKHIDLASKDVDLIKTSSRKIISNFEKIDNLDLTPDESNNYISEATEPEPAE